MVVWDKKKHNETFYEDKVETRYTNDYTVMWNNFTETRYNTTVETKYRKEWVT